MASLAAFKTVAECDYWLEEWRSKSEAMLGTLEDWQLQAMAGDMLSDSANAVRDAIGSSDGNARVAGKLIALAIVEVIRRRMVEKEESRRTSAPATRKG